MIALDKYGHHQPLGRQAERIAREGIDLSQSMLAPIHPLIERYMLDDGCLHGDDTTVPLLARERGGDRAAPSSSRQR